MRPGRVVWPGSVRRGMVVAGVVAMALAAMVAAGAAGLSNIQEVAFPHEEHEGLFPVCTGCHEAPDAGEAPGYPEAALCARCHDGAQLPTVTWSDPADVATNVVFDHARHASQLEDAGEPVQSCVACHSPAAGPTMALEDRVREESCFTCHASGTDGHFEADSTGMVTCALCHVPLSRSRFLVQRIASLPVPEDHERGSFLARDHGLAAAAESPRCATCHTQDRCLSCHVDGGGVVVASIPPAPPEMELPPAAAGYPVPEGHQADDFARAHAPVDGPADCATCHTSNDCRSCHVAAPPATVGGLTDRAHARAPGVGLTRTAPESHASPFFVGAHGNLSAADDATCATCHAESDCTDCHDGPAGVSYHPPDFAGAHAAVAFGRADECASCHETAVFCRSCHVESGLGSQGRLGAGYHDAEPVWLLRHGQAARQNLESCASCHQQRDCVQCHGVLGSFKVSPHGPDFDAEGAWARSPRTCLACHVGNPLGGGAR